MKVAFPMLRAALAAVLLTAAPASADPIVLRGHDDQVPSVAFSPDGARVASASFDGTVRLWDAASGEAIATLTGHGDRVRCVAFSSDGTRLVTGSYDQTLRLWDVGRSEASRVLRGHTGWVLDATFSPDGTRVASTSTDGTIRLWDVRRGAELSALREDGRPVFSVAFSPDGARLATGGRDGQIRIWDAAAGELDATWQRFGGELLSVAFSPDGTRLASATRIGTMKVWDVSTGEPADWGRHRAHEEDVHAVLFTPDGARLVSCSNDRTIRLWDATTGAPLAEFLGHEGWVRSVAISPDGRRIASGSADGTVRIWEIDAGTPVEGWKPNRAGEPRTLHQPVVEIEVIEDVAQIDAARALAVRLKGESIDRALEMLEREPYYSWSAAAIAREFPDEVVPRLVAIARDETRSTETRRRAIDLLRSVGDQVPDVPRLDERAPVLLEGLNALTPEQRVKALQAIQFRRESMPVDPALHPRLLELLEDPDERVRKTAIQVCGIQEIPGAAERFAVMARDPDAVGRERMIFWLARQGRPEALDMLFEQLEAEREGARIGQSSSTGLWSLLRSASPEVRARAIELMVAYAELVLEVGLVEEPPPDSSEQPGDAHFDVVRRLAEHGDARALGVLGQLAATPRFGGDALLGLARLDPDLAQRIAVDMLRSDQVDHDAEAALVLGRVAAGSKDESLVAALRHAAERDTEPEHDWWERGVRRDRIAGAAARIGGPAGERLATELLKELRGPRTPAEILWLVEGRTLEGALDHCLAIGLIDRLPDAETIAEIESYSPGFRYERREVEQLLKALEPGGVRLIFDAESDRLPCRHDLLLQEFADRSRGRFAPEAASEVLIDEEDLEKGYTVQFVHGDRLYRFHAAYRGDWYDIGPVVEAIHRALADAGHAERFHYVPGAEQMAEYLFATPEVIARFEHDFAVPTGGGADAATRAGQAFEQRVREKLGR